MSSHRLQWATLTPAWERLVSVPRSTRPPQRAFPNFVQWASVSRSHMPILSKQTEAMPSWNPPLSRVNPEVSGAIASRDRNVIDARSWTQPLRNSTRTSREPRRPTKSVSISPNNSSLSSRLRRKNRNDCWGMTWSQLSTSKVQFLTLLQVNTKLTPTVSYI